MGGNIRTANIKWAKGTVVQCTMSRSLRHGNCLGDRCHGEQCWLCLQNAYTMSAVACRLLAVFSELVMKFMVYNVPIHALATERL
jgi:hypothetical protein